MEIFSLGPMKTGEPLLSRILLKGSLVYQLTTQDKIGDVPEVKVLATSKRPAIFFDNH